MRTRTRPTRTELPDVRDGLTRTQRVVLVTLRAMQAERGGRSVPVAELYGRVLEQLDLSQDALLQILAEAGAGRSGE